MNEEKMRKRVLATVKVEDWVRPEKPLEEFYSEERETNITPRREDVENDDENDEDIIGTTMCAKTRRGYTLKPIAIDFSMQGGEEEEPFLIHSVESNDRDWGGGEQYLCDKLRINPNKAGLSISRSAAENIVAEL